jgi:HTH-type transcriptional repressor of NAD biosynthesis genes
VELDTGVQKLSFPQSMKRGLVIGKFMPIHVGHVALVEFAAAQCDELIVSMSFTSIDHIGPHIRFNWIQEIFKDRPNIKPAMEEDNFDDETLPLMERTKIWADFIRKKFQTIHVVFSSEDYGLPFANNLNCAHVSFDATRNQFPVSASLIRKNPFRYWNFIPEVVKPYYVKRICFYGPESTGKSNMAERFAKKYDTQFVPEVARELLTKNDFTVEDIIAIGHAHYNRIHEKLKTANKILFCDTDAITTQIYSQHYLGIVPPVLYELETKVIYDLYVLFDIDVPWIPDGLRDLPHLRQEMFLQFKQALEKRNIHYVLVSGSWQQRETIVEHSINKLLQADLVK